MSFLRDAAVGLVVALKGHSIPREASTAYQRLCNEIARSLEVSESQMKRKHSCPDWDYMVIDEDSPEFEACLCYPEIDCTDEQLIAEVRRRGFVIRDAQVGKKWIGLSEEEVAFIWNDMGARPKINGYDFAKVIEEKLKEKNYE